MLKKIFTACIALSAMMIASQSLDAQHFAKAFNAFNHNLYGGANCGREISNQGAAALWSNYCYDDCSVNSAYGGGCDGGCGGFAVAAPSGGCGGSCFGYNTAPATFAAPALAAPVVAAPAISYSAPAFATTSGGGGCGCGLFKKLKGRGGFGGGCGGGSCFGYPGAGGCGDGCFGGGAVPIASHDYSGAVFGGFTAPAVATSYAASSCGGGGCRLFGKFKRCGLFGGQGLHDRLFSGFYASHGAASVPSYFGNHVGAETGFADFSSHMHGSITGCCGGSAQAFAAAPAMVSAPVAAPAMTTSGVNAETAPQSVLNSSVPAGPAIQAPVAQTLLPPVPAPAPQVYSVAPAFGAMQFSAPAYTTAPVYVPGNFQRNRGCGCFK